MRTFVKMFCLLAALAAPGLGLADDAAVDARAWANIDAILAYCANLDPSNAAKYVERGKLMAQGVDEKALSKIRKSDEYHHVYAAMTDQAKKSDPETVRGGCGKFLTGK